MADAPVHSESTVDALLEQRTRYEQWLARLDEAGNRAPDAVRERVRADYRSRLEQVVEQLRGHAATISADLDRLRGERARLERRRDAAQEAIAEAEVRHAVGEYGEDEWRRISDEQNGTLAGVTGELGRVETELERLSEVERLVAGEPARPVHAPEPVPPEAVLVSDPEIETPAPPEPAEPEPFVPAPAPAQEDELAFLQSVTGDVPAQQPPAPPAPPAAPPEPIAPAQEPPRADTTTSGKTLRCGECGTLNRPTEWYCERCGAELAAL
jgi:hypothetical protein